jgi:DNA-binding FrmR family transcriptional regulator
VGWPRKEDRVPFKDENRANAVNRLKTVRGHLSGIIRMIEEDSYCVDVMKQVSAAQSSLERVNRVVLRNHLETCFSQSVKSGTAEAAIDELVDAVKFNSALTGPGLRLARDVTAEASTGEEAS